MFERLRFLFKTQSVLIVLTILCGIFWINFYEKSILFRSTEESNSYTQNTNYKCKEEKEKLFTNDILAWYNGESGRPIYLALLGRVYDVTRGAKHYGPGCAYNFFVGRDTSLSFITGDFDIFEPGKADDVLSLKPSDILSLLNWEKFYETDYVYKGKLIGRFYNEDGQPTEYFHKFRTLVGQIELDKINKQSIRTKYPDCNIEWSVEKGSRVWCTTSSGGKKRDWIGYPRRLYEIGNDNFRCACVKEDDLNTDEVMIKPYENCDHFSHECYYFVDDV